MTRKAPGGVYGLSSEVVGQTKKSGVHSKEE